MTYGMETYWTEATFMQIVAAYQSTKPGAIEANPALSRFKVGNTPLHHPHHDHREAHVELFFACTSFVFCSIYYTLLFYFRLPFPIFLY